MKDEIIAFFEKLFSTEDFPARWFCGNWSDFQGWLYIFSQALIWSAYLMIPLLIFRFISKSKKIPFTNLLFLFIAFILLCGLTHFIEIIIFWVPIYRINALVLLATGIVSWITVGALYKNLGKLFSLKTPEQLYEIVEQKTIDLELLNQKLKSSESELKALVNSNPDIISKIDKGYIYRFVNESITSVRGLLPIDYIGKSIFEMYADADNASVFKSKIDEVFAKNKEINFQSNLKINNQLSIYQNKLIPITDEYNVPEAVLIVARNITAEIQFENELKNSINNFQKLSEKLSLKNEKLEEFTFIVSHNLRAPIGNLTALSGLFEIENEPDEKIKIFKKIKAVNKKLQETIDNLSVVLTNKENDQLPIENLNFAEEWNSILISLSSVIKEKKVSFDVDFTDCESINFPKAYLESILLNLTTNAIKYSSPDRTPKILIKTSLQKGKTHLIFSDNGLGIDLTKYKNRLFGLNQAFHNNSDSKGVGLFLVKSHIEQMGGSISVESEIGVGTTFYIQF